MPAKMPIQALKFVHTAFNHDTMREESSLLLPLEGHLRQSSHLASL